MNYRIVIAALLGAAVLGGVGQAQQAPAPSPLDIVPDTMSFNTPYGAPIALANAKQLIDAVVAETAKRGWAESVAVIDSGGNLVAFERMDGAMLASIAISEHKARVAVKLRRPTHVLEDGIQKSGVNALLTLDDIIAFRGGIPLVQDGKIIGAIGCSGGTASQDETVCMVGAGMVK